MNMLSARELHEAKVIPVPETGCWLATRFNGRWNYGALTIRGRSMGLHRWAWTIFHGEIPEGKMVCHKCDTPQCSNPDHLFLGDGSDNQKDSVTKGRQWGPRLKGETNGRARLTAEQVRELRALPAPIRNYPALCEKYGVTRACIRSVRGGYNWKHVPKDALGEER